MPDTNDTSGKLVWFFAGAAIGAAIALLYAPASGPETRKRIGKKVGEGRSALRDGSKEILEKGRGLYERGKQIAEDAADVFERGKKLVEDASSAVAE